MLIYLPVMIFVSFTSKFSHCTTSEGCGIQNEVVYITDLPPAENEEGIPACPAESKDDIKNIEEKAAKYSELKYCLFKETIPENGSALCNREVKPVMYMVKDKNNNPIRCGSRKQHFLHNFGYVYCQKMTDDQIHNTDTSKKTVILDDMLITYIKTYTVCYDILNSNTIWTRHQVLSIFKDPDFINETYCPKEISSDAYYENSQIYFKTLETEFDQEIEYPSTAFPMVPHHLVPAEHFALRSWKKTTNHYINVAPMWQHLVLLMNIIDEGIYNAATKVYLDRYNSKSLENGLVIYTKVKEVITFRDKILDWFFKRGNFQPSIWYKFIYDPITEQGVMIYIHNTPGTKVEKNIRDKNVCDFKLWTDDKNTRETISLYLLQDYAYCSKVTSKDIRKLFHIDVKIREVLDINTLSRK